MSTPGATKESESKTRVDLVDSITSHLFDQLLQDGLGVCSSTNLAVHNVSMSISWLLLVLYAWLFLWGFIFTNFASQSSQKFPLQYVAIYETMKHQENHEIKLSRISPSSPKSRKYLYAKYTWCIQYSIWKSWNMINQSSKHSLMCDCSLSLMLSTYHRHWFTDLQWKIDQYHSEVGNNMILANRVGPWCPKIIIDSTWLYILYFHLIQSNKPSFIWKWHKWDNFRDIFLIKQCWTEASSVTYMYVTWCPTKLIPTTFFYFHQERNYCVSNYFQSMYLI